MVCAYMCMEYQIKVGVFVWCRVYDEYEYVYCEHVYGESDQSMCIVWMMWCVWYASLDERGCSKKQALFYFCMNSRPLEANCFTTSS
ncbi:hypothetical protein EON63_01460 [archaeon]|nr:MAG: hypothetical protein EON63_01460 [archaeon]